MCHYSDTPLEQYRANFGSLWIPLETEFFCSHSGSFVPLLSSALTLGVLVKRQFTLFIIWFLIWNICNYFRKEQVIWIWLCSLYHPRQHFIRNPRWWCAIAIAILHFAFQNGTEPTTTTMTMAKKKEFNMRKTTNGRKFFAALNEKQRTKMHTDKRVKNSACATRAPFLNWNESKARSNTLTHTHTPNVNIQMRIVKMRMGCESSFESKRNCELLRTCFSVVFFQFN